MSSIENEQNSSDFKIDESGTLGNIVRQRRDPNLVNPPDKTIQYVDHIHLLALSRVNILVTSFLAERILMLNVDSETPKAIYDYLDFINLAILTNIAFTLLWLSAINIKSDLHSSTHHKTLNFDLFSFFSKKTSMITAMSKERLHDRAYLKLPELKHLDTSNNALSESLKSDVVRIICDSVIEMQRSIPQVSNILIDAPESLYSVMNYEPNTTRNKIISRDDIRLHLKGEDKPIIDLPINELQYLVFDKRNAYHRLLEELNNAKLIELLKIAAQHKGKKRTEALQLVFQHIDLLLQNEIEKNFTTTKIARMPYESLNPNLRYVGRQKISTFQQILRLDEGFKHIEIQYENGEIRTQQLDKKLKLDNKTVESVIQSNSRYRRAQMLFMLNDVLIKNDLDDLIKKRIETPEELIEELNKNNLSLERRRAFLEDVDNLKTFKANLTINYVTSYMIKFLATIALLTFIPKLTEPDYITLHYQRTSEYDLSTSALSGPENDNFPLWKVTAQNLELHSYWTTNTLHYFSTLDHSWLGNSVSMGKNLSLPHSFNTEKPHIKLEGYLHANDLLFVPVNEKTKVSAIHFNNDFAKGVEISTLEFSDGAIGLYYTLEQKSQYIPDSIPITVYLTPAESNSVHAIPIEDDYVEQDQINGKIRLLYDEAINEAQPNNYTEIAQIFSENISNGFYYGRDSLGNILLRDTKDGTDFINTAGTVEEMKCNLANTVFNLAMPEESGLNYTQGFWGTHIITDTETIDNGYLLSSSLHAFNVDKNGDIFDATPTTLRFENHETVDVDKDVIDSWSYIQKNTEAENSDILDKKREEQKSNRLRSIFLTSPFLLFGALKMKNKFSINKSGMIKNILLQVLIGNKSFQKSSQFLLHTFWANKNNEAKLDQITSKYIEKNTVESVKRNIRLDVLLKYLENPQQYEPKSWWPLLRYKTRLLAKHIAKN